MRSCPSSPPPFPEPRTPTHAHRLRLSAARLVAPAARGRAHLGDGRVRLVPRAVRHDAALATEGPAEPVRHPTQGRADALLPAGAGVLAMAGQIRLPEPGL